MKIVTALLASLFVFVHAHLFAQQQTGEYFFDEDPGVGNGIPLFIGQAGQEMAADMAVSLEGLLPGPHVLGIRLLGKEGEWGLTQARRFYIEVPAERPETPSIVAAEAFFDEDPGAGAGIPLPVAEDTSRLRSNHALSVAGLGSGAHRMGIRLKDSAGNWSLNGYTRFFIEEKFEPYQPDRQQITEIEYFLDSLDPGQGQAVSLVPPVQGYQVSVTDMIDLDTTTLQPGRHHLLARARDAAGRWGLTFVQPFDFCIPGSMRGGFTFEQEQHFFTFTDTSKNAVEYIWHMGNGDSLFVAEPRYTYPQGGQFTICQTVYSFCDTVTTCHDVLVPTPRVISEIADLSILEDQPFFELRADLKQVFEDASGDPLVFGAFTDNDSLQAEIRQGQALWLQASNHFHGQAALVLSAEGGGVTLYDTVMVTVLSVNDTPRLLQPFEDQFYDEDTGPRLITANIRTSIQDVEDRTLDIEVFATSPGLKPRLISGVRLQVDLDQDFNGTGEVIILATDDSLATGEFSFRVEVLPMPDAPRLVAHLPDTLVPEDAGEIVLFPDLRRFFKDPENDVVSFQVVGDYEELQWTVNGNSLHLQTAENFTGVRPVIIRASDGNLFAADTFNLEVASINDLPAIASTGELLVCPGEALELHLPTFVTDADHAFSQLQVSASVVAAAQGGVPLSALQAVVSGETLRLSSSLNSPADFTLKLEVTDPEGGKMVEELPVVVFRAAIVQTEGVLLAPDGDTWQWLKDGVAISGATGQQLPLNQAGLYQVTVSRGNCTHTSPGMVITSLPDALGSRLQLYPNPAGEILHIDLELPARAPLQIQLLDVTGRQWLQEQFLPASQLRHTLSLKPLPAGIYFLQVQAGRQSSYRKILKR